MTSDVEPEKKRSAVSPALEKDKQVEKPGEDVKKKHKRSHSKSPEHGRKHKSSRRDREKDYQVAPRYYDEGKNSDDEHRRRDRRNDDRYWTKYPKKDEGYVGKRYYEGKGGESDRNKRDQEKDNSKDVKDKRGAEQSTNKPKERKKDMLTSRTGGAYIPPAKLRLMQAAITDKSSAEFQRIAWEALKKSIHGYINKVNTSNIGIIARELLHENIIRGRGLLCKSIIQAQAFSPTFTNVYSALVAVINSKFPSIGELLLKRLVLQFKRGFKQNNKTICISAANFIAHLVNQNVAHEILALEILTLLIETPTCDSIEVAIAFLKECGQKLSEVSSTGMNAIFEMLRNILHEGKLEARIQYMVEVMFQTRKDGFKDHAAIIEELDIVEEDDQFTHLIKLDDVKQTEAEDILNVFKFDDDYAINEGKYKILSKEILQSDSESGSGSDGESGSEEESDDDEDEEEEKGSGAIVDNTETNLIALRRTIYLTIQSSLHFEECAHKLLKMELKPGQEIELCHMFLDCCAEQRTYEKFYGYLAERFCQINKIYVEPFQQIFKDTYATTHRLDANRLRNVSNFFAHLLHTDAISWEVLEIVKMTEEDTNSSSRIFLKILFQVIVEHMGLVKLNARLKDPTMQGHFAGLFPRDNPKNTRFSINFFTSIGLGGLTNELREHFEELPKHLPVVASESESSSSSSSSSSSEDSSSESSSEEESPKTDKKRRENKNTKKPNDSPRRRPRKTVDERDRRDHKDDSRRSNKDKRKDYEWVKSRYEDNINQLKDRRRAFARSRSRDRDEKKRSSRSDKDRRDLKGKSEKVPEKESRHKGA